MLSWGFVHYSNCKNKEHLWQTQSLLCPRYATYITIHKENDKTVSQGYRHRSKDLRFFYLGKTTKELTSVSGKDKVLSVGYKKKNQELDQNPCCGQTGCCCRVAEIGFSPRCVITCLPWLRPWPEIQTHSTVCWYLWPEIEVKISYYVAVLKRNASTILGM